MGLLEPASRSAPAEADAKADFWGAKSSLSDVTSKAPGRIEIGLYELYTPLSPPIDGVFSTPVKIAFSTHIDGMRHEDNWNTPLSYGYELLCSAVIYDWDAALRIISPLNTHFCARYTCCIKPLWFLINAEAQRSEMISAFREASRVRAGRPSSIPVLSDGARVDGRWLFERLSKSSKTNRGSVDNAYILSRAKWLRFVIAEACADRLPRFQQNINLNGGPNGKTVDAVQRYQSSEMSPKREIAQFAHRIELLPIAEFVSEMIEGLSEYSSRQIARALNLRADDAFDDRGVLHAANIPQLLAAAQLAMEKQKGRPRKDALNSCVRTIKDTWRDIAGPKAVCIAYPGPYGDCYDLVGEINEKLAALGLETSLPIEPLTE